MTAADILVEKLIDWGVEFVFGLPGDGINGIMEALRTRQDKIRFIQVRHEESAAFMACGYAKMTGKIGVCLATSGPGAIHLLNGLYDAKLDYQPVLAITGLQFHDLIGTLTQQDVECDKLFIDACVYNQRIMGPTHVENVVELAIRTALSYHGVAHVTIPVDIQEQELKDKDRSKRNKADHVSDVWARGARMPDDRDLAKASEILNAGKKIAILAGAGALHATDELEQIAELLGAPIAKALLGKACVPDDSPYTTGSIGLLGTSASQKMMKECDTLLIVGAGFPYIEYYPDPGKAKCVQIDLNPTHISLRYPVDVGLVGDSKKTLQQLLPRLKRNENRDFLTSAQKQMKDWWEFMEKEGTADSQPMKPQVVAWELGKRLPNDAIVTCDSGTIATWYARHIPARRGMKMTLSGNLATMAPGLPYALAAQLAYPDRPVIAFVGDGGFSMLMADFVTAVKYKLPIKVVIIKNNYLGQIKWEQMVFLGNPEFGVDLHPIDFVKVAEACGGTGFHLEDAQAAGDTMERFLNHPGPAVLEAVVDPLTAPLPGSIKAEQALHFVESLVKGEPDAQKIFTTAMKDKARQLL
jgi:pyruvate dehydrogenase (quinone)/pyruvate oxidase